MLQIHLHDADEASQATTVAALLAWASEHGAELVQASPGPGGAPARIYLEGLGDRSLVEALVKLPGVARVEDAGSPSRLVESMPARPVAVGPAVFGGGQASFIAGPCAVEDEERLLSLAQELRAGGASALRGGAFKPRTSPYGFQGLGERGLAMLGRVGRATGLPVCTEVLDPRDLELVAEHADMLQVGSRNMHNSALLQEIGRVGMPVLLKRGMAATLDEFLYAAEYLAVGGADEIVLCERGLRHFDPAMRNVLDLAAVPALQARTGLPVVVDPSHGTGRSDLVPPMLAAAAAAGADGFLVEVHRRPDSSWSDAGQAISPDTFAAATAQVDAVLQACGRRLARPQAAPAS